MNRYLRQIMLSDFGLHSQQKLKASAVLVVGAGGLGCPALQYLNAAGIGTIGILDADRVSENNLHRQILYTPKDIGRYKVEAARDLLGMQNPETKIRIYPEHLSEQNALDIIAEYDIILDGTDHPACRYLIADACEVNNKPWVYAALYAHEGQLAVMNHLYEGVQCNYRDVFPWTENQLPPPACHEAGVLGVYTGILGSMQAAEAIKVLTGYREAMSNRILYIHFGNYASYSIEIRPDRNRIRVNEKSFYFQPRGTQDQLT